MAQSPQAGLNEGYKLFLALLRPTEWGGVCLPRQFADSYRTAFLESILPGALGLTMEGDRNHKYITGIIDNPFLRASADVMLENVVNELERAPDWCFRVTGLGGKYLQLNRVDEAKTHYDFFNGFVGEEFKAIYDAFPQQFVTLSPEHSFELLGRTPVLVGTRQ